MKHTPVEGSSWISSIGFENGILEIKNHTGKILRYGSGDGPGLEMTKEVHDKFLAAESKGKFYNQFIKKIYPVA